MPVHRVVAAFIPLLLAAVSSQAQIAPGLAPEIIVSVRNQTISVFLGRERQAEFPVSTSRFGIGDEPRSFRTPLGAFVIDRKLGDKLPSGAVLKGLQFTGEVVSPNTPGRDPIVTRVLCLKGTESRNGRAAARGIYIHGTPEEKSIGKPASYGCIRMRSRDVIALFSAVPVGTHVTITDVPRADGLRNGQREDDWYR